MPWSSDEGKLMLQAAIVQRAPLTVLDIGAGSGTYASLLRPFLGRVALMTAVEVFEPYIDRFNLREKYDEVILGDARRIDLPIADVVILGDVLEHMQLGDALRLWDRARNAARDRVFLSLPIVEWVQDVLDGNEHEAHLVTWSDEMVERLLYGVRKVGVYEHIGVYYAVGRAR